ncbi:unnamed protein product [Sphagnum jensenii]|uniref:Ribosomal protein L2 n=1 Tax=Sphagnum jensenii TaxID=128206 RepID=A0ABP1A3P1_9BRYO
MRRSCEDIMRSRAVTRPGAGAGSVVVRLAGVERIEEHPALVADGSSSSSVSCLCKNAHWLARDATETMRRHSFFAARAGGRKGRRQRDGETPRRFRHGKKIPPPGVGRVFDVVIPSGLGT